MDIENLLARLPAGFDPQAECERALARLEALDEGLAEITATATSPDGLVRVVVGARGELRALDLDPRLYHRPDSAALASAILAAAAEAAAEAAERAAELTGPALSAGARNGR